MMTAFTLNLDEVDELIRGGSIPPLTALDIAEQLAATIREKEKRESAAHDAISEILDIAYLAKKLGLGPAEHRLFKVVRELQYAYGHSASSEGADGATPSV